MPKTPEYPSLETCRASWLPETSMLTQFRRGRLHLTLAAPFHFKWLLLQKKNFMFTLSISTSKTYTTLVV